MALAVYGEVTRDIMALQVLFSQGSRQNLGKLLGWIMEAVTRCIFIFDFFTLLVYLLLLLLGLLTDVYVL